MKKIIKKIVIIIKEWKIIEILNKNIIEKKYNGIFNIFTHLEDKEKIMIYRIAKKVKKTVVIEIGSYLGASSCFFAIGLKQGTVYCIDTWQNDAMTEGQKDTFQLFMENTGKYTNKIVPIKGWSYKVINEIKDKIGKDKIGILFIDADHSYEGVKKDWDLYSKLIEKNAIVIFHDYGWADGVKRLIHEEVIKNCKKYKSLPNMWWGWIK